MAVSVLVIGILFGLPYYLQPRLEAEVGKLKDEASRLQEDTLAVVIAGLGYSPEGMSGKEINTRALRVYDVAEKHGIKDQLVNRGILYPLDELPKVIEKAGKSLEVAEQENKKRNVLATIDTYRQITIARKALLAQTGYNEYLGTLFGLHDNLHNQTP